MSPRLCVALLALCCLAAASDPDCEELLKPELELSKIFGKWFHQIGTANSEERLRDILIFQSSWFQFSPIPDTGNMNQRWNDRINGSCDYGGADTTITRDETNMTITVTICNLTYSGRYLKSYNDCIVWVSRVVNADGSFYGGFIHLFSKTEKVDDAALEFFKKQAKCLNFPEEFYVPDTTDWCPEQTEPPPSVPNCEYSGPIHSP